MENYSIATFCFRIESSQVEEELRNTLAAIPLIPSHTKTWSDRKEQVELSWGNHRPGIFEDVVSSMAMPSGAVCTVYAYVSIYPYMYKFSRDVNFADDPNLGFPQFYFRGSYVIIPCASSALQLFYKISRI